MNPVEQRTTRYTCKPFFSCYYFAVDWLKLVSNLNLSSNSYVHLVKKDENCVIFTNKIRYRKYEMKVKL